MTSRERLRRCYFHEELDRPGVYSRTNYPAGDPSYDRLKAYLQTHADLKQSWSGRQFELPATTEQWSEPHSEEFDRRVTILHTPKGDLRSTRFVSRRGLPGFEETYFIKSRQDAEAYLALPLPEVAGDVTAFLAADRALGARGIMDVTLGLNPAGFVAELCGSELFALMSVTDRDILLALCERQMRIILNALKFLLARNVGPYFSMLGEEFAVPPLHGWQDFRDFNVQFDKPILDLIHNAGGRIHIHCHGSIKTVFQGFLEVGADVLHPFEAPPMGDLTPAEAKKFAHGRLCLEGNIQIADMYEKHPPHIREQTRALIKTCFADRRGLIVSPTASPYIRGAGEQCFPQYQAMVDEVLAFTPV
ncbi:MAG: hypothetical protein PCFJNLEI_00726 [Verrucomicrobiae bacterium]|nr:hypothetical protein [Verrucomicrobiae bacterium]